MITADKLNHIEDGIDSNGAFMFNVIAEQSADTFTATLDGTTPEEVLSKVASGYAIAKVSVTYTGNPPAVRYIGMNSYAEAYGGMAFGSIIMNTGDIETVSVNSNGVSYWVQES